MPPRRSQRSKRPSSQALEPLVTSPPQRARRQNQVVEGNLPSSSSDQQASMVPEVLVSASSVVSVKLGPDCAERWTQRTEHEWTAPGLEAQKMQRVIEAELVCSCESALAEARSPIVQAMAGTSL